MEDIISYLKGKSIVIYGFGREGRSTYKFIRKYLKDEKILIFDKNISEIASKTDTDLNLDKHVILTNEDDLYSFESYDLIFKTPGISFYGKDISPISGKITSQIELFLKFANVYTIGVTGTKGKSTTSSLIYQILKDQGKKVRLIGNIGVPVFECLDEISDIDYAVVEVSAHQLQYVDVSFNISILLNLFEEHLDHFGDYISYINAKLNIFRFQKKGDFAIYNLDNNTVVENVEKLNLNSTKVGISCNNSKKGFKFDFDKERKLLGKHNEINILFALKVASILKLDEKITSETIYNFSSLPHRMEFVGIYNGVNYYNDSISTIPEAAIACMESIRNVGTIILGGLNRGINYSELARYLLNSNIDNVICFSSTGKIIYDMLKENFKNNLVYCNTFEECVKEAVCCTKKGKSCVLSPAAASYNMFKNFEERGEIFKQLVKKYNKN